MFIFDFVVDTILEGIMNWIFEIIMDALSEFFAMMGNMGAELFDETWVQAIVLFFNYFGWTMFAVGLVVAVFECAIESQNGRGSIKDTALNALKGFMAVSLVTTVPVELYKFCISLQTQLTGGMTSLIGGGMGEMSTSALDIITGRAMGVVITLAMIIMLGYSVIKVFFANLKRGGILLIQIAAGSLYMFSVPRGYTDGFIQWCKQTIAICFTAFMQTVILFAGLGVMQSELLLGLGLIFAAAEVPRIAQQFGLETSTKGNIMSSVYAMQSAVTITKTITSSVK